MPSKESGEEESLDQNDQEQQHGESSIQQDDPKKVLIDFNGVGETCLEGLEKLMTSVDEFKQLKDAVVQCDIPRPLQLRLLSINGSMNRGVAALYHPLFELVRLVGLYSQGWEEKGSVLSTLHKNYDTHHRQLHVALSKLQNEEGELQKLKRERLILIWEGLFARAMANQRHGRRWKYLIESFRQRAEKGHLLMYDSDDDDDSGDEDESYESKLPLKPSSKKGKIPELLAAAERREKDRQRIHDDLQALREEVSVLQERNEKLRDQLDRSLIKPPVANKSCMASILTPTSKNGDDESNHELLEAVSEAVSLISSRTADTTQTQETDLSENSGDQLRWEEEEITTNIYVLEIEGLSHIGIPEASLEVSVSGPLGTLDATSKKLNLQHNILGNLRVGTLFQMAQISPSTSVEFSIYSGLETKKLMAVGSVDGNTVLDSFHIHQRRELKDIVQETNVLTTTSIELVVMPDLETFCGECDLEVPSEARISFLASPYNFTDDQQIKVLTPLTDDPFLRISRRTNVKKELEEVSNDEEKRLESAKDAQTREDPASSLFDLLDVNADDLRQATFTMEEMMDLTLLHTKQLQALQSQYEEQIMEIEEKYKPIETKHSVATVQTDPTEPEIKLVEVEKVVEKVVEKIVEVEKIIKEEVRVEVPVEVPVYSKEGRRSQVHFGHKFTSPLRNPFLERLAEYAKRSLARLEALKKKVEGERDYVIRAQMASKYVLDESDKKVSEPLHRRKSNSDDSVCLPAMFMPNKSGSFSSRHNNAWYPMNSPTREKHQPPSMVSLPPIRLPPVSNDQSIGELPDEILEQKQPRPSSSQQQQRATPSSSSNAPDTYAQHLNSYSKNSPFALSTRLPSRQGESMPSDAFMPSPNLPRRGNPKSAQYAMLPQQQQQKEPTVYAWRRMKMANLRESLQRGETPNEDAGTGAKNDTSFPWPGRK